MNKLYCNDGCQETFYLSQVHIKMEQLPEKVERHYIECPHCKTQYTSYYLNDQIKQIQEEIKRLSGKEQLKIKQKNKLFKLKRTAIALSEQLKDQMERGDKAWQELH